jgi:rubrerythrin
MDSGTDVFLKWGLDLNKLPKAVAESKEPIVRFFAWHDAHPIAISMVLLEAFGADWVTWEALTLRTEIVKTFNATSVSDNNWNKIQAVRTLLSTTAFWDDWEIFEKVIQALNNNVPRFDILQRCNTEQLMSGVDIANDLRNEDFGNEIVQYTAACLVDEGITHAPEPLDFAGRALAKPMYRCLDCGNVDTDDLSDGRCDFCCGRYQKFHNLDGKAAPWIPADVGKNIERYVTRDPAEVAQRYEKIKDLQDYEADPASVVDVPAAKLAVAYQYMQMRRKQLVEQLKELASWVKQ